jgi:hypothetical protein
MKISILVLLSLFFLNACSDKKVPVSEAPAPVTPVQETPAPTTEGGQAAQTVNENELSFVCILKDKQIQKILKKAGKSMSAEEREALEAELNEIEVAGKVSDLTGGEISIEGPVAVGHEINNEGKNKIDSVKLYRKVRKNEDQLDFMVFDNKAPSEEGQWQRNYFKLSIGKKSIVDFRNFNTPWEKTFESPKVEQFLAYLTIWSGVQDKTNDLVEELPKMICDVTSRQVITNTQGQEK